MNREYKASKEKKKKSGCLGILLIITALIASLSLCTRGGNTPKTEELTTEAVTEGKSPETAAETEITGKGTAQEYTEASSKNDYTEETSIEETTTEITEETKDSIAKAQTIPSGLEKRPFEMTMLDVHQGLALLFKADGEYMLYDGGGRSRSSYVVSYLKQHGVTDLKYMTASHYDEDHIAGLVGVLHTTKTKAILCPDYETDSKIYQSFVTSSAASGAEIINPSAGDSFLLGNAIIEVVGADNNAEQENDRSIAIKVTYGNCKVLVTGDAQEAEEAEILRNGYDIDSDVYIAGHHGSQYSSGTNFLNAVTPSYTFFSCGEGNSYGHPTIEAITRVKNTGSQISRSDKQKEVTLYSNGESYWFSKEPSDDWTPGTAEETGVKKSQEMIETSQESPVESASATTKYVLNYNSMKFHYPDCTAVKKISENNYGESDKNRNELINEGFSPCGICHP